MFGLKTVGKTAKFMFWTMPSRVMGVDQLRGGNAGESPVLPAQLPVNRFLVWKESVLPDNFLPGRSLDLDVHPSRQAELVEGLDRLGRGLDDIDQSFVSSYFKLLTSFLINRRPGQDRIPLDPRRQWNWPVDLAVRPLGRIDNFQGALIEDGMVVCLHPNPNHLFRCCHVLTPYAYSKPAASVIKQTTPANFDKIPS